VSTVAEAIAQVEAEQQKRAARKEPSDKRIRSWYNSWEWKRVRYNFILRNKERKCACCNATAASGERMVVGHIKPVRKYWHLRADYLHNLMWLCDSCNRGMGSRDETDWRAEGDKADELRTSP
jgi:5-methylcytosine-specific restriction endonuclease McrA